MKSCTNFSTITNPRLMSSNRSILDKTIINICQYEYKSFLCKSNVIGLGLGFKTIRGLQTCRKCIKIFVTNKYPANTIHPKDLIPSCYNGIITDVVAIGRPTSMLGTNIDNSPLRTRVRPVTGGYSISSAEFKQYGSFACLARDSDNDLCVLSSNHVIAHENQTPLGTPIVQPGTLDGGTPPMDTIANLSKFQPIDFSGSTNYVDCALAKVTDPSLVSASITFIGPPTGIGQVDVGYSVKKVGAASGLTTGTVESIGTTIIVDFPSGKSALFRDQITTTKMTEAGDSGAALLDSGNRVAGLFMSSTSTSSIVNAIGNVLIYLDATLVTG